MRYGIGYKGSKSRIAKDIIDLLPKGNRFIDLFGGGGAISHCASLSGKYKKVIYNDLNSSIYTLVKNTFSGFYKDSSSLFDWVSRDKFKDENEHNPIIKWCWSFGNNGLDYLYSKENEYYKEAIHRAIVNKEYSDLFLEITDGVIPFSYNNDILLSKKEWYSFYKTLKDTKDYRLQALERIIQIKDFESLHNVSFLNTTYMNYVYQEGDIVYCDPPYCGRRQDAYRGFNSDEFIEWSRKIPCYISEYDMPEDFIVIFSKNVQNTSNRINNSMLRAEEKLFKSPAFKIGE